MSEYRSAKRIYLVNYLLVFDRKTDQQAGHVFNISISGMKLMSKDFIAPGQSFQLGMTLPAVMETSREITLNAKSVWSKSNLYSDFFGTGFSFEKISADDIKIVHELIARFGC